MCSVVDGGIVSFFRQDFDVDFVSVVLSHASRLAHFFIETAIKSERTWRTHMIPEEASHGSSVFRDFEDCSKTSMQEVILVAHNCRNAHTFVVSLILSRIAYLPHQQRPILHIHVRFIVASWDGVVQTDASRPRLDGPVLRKVGGSVIGI